MTVIAWDGRYVASDKQGTSQGTKTTVTKLFVHGLKVYAICGNPDHGMSMVAWLKSGGLPKDHPKEPDIKTSAWVYVFERGKHVACYEQHVTPFFAEDPIFTAGSGGDAAYGALRYGATVRQAVEIACDRDTGCGMGVDVIDTWELTSERTGPGDQPAHAPAGGAPGA